MQFLGISAFALLNANFPTKQFLSQYPCDYKKPAIAVLLNYFGKKAKNLKAFTDKFADRPHLVELHLGFRDFTTSELMEMRAATRKIIEAKIKEAKRVIKVAGNKNTKFIICPILEDNVTLAAWKKYASMVRKELKYPLVRSTVGKDFGGGRYEELHTVRPRFHRPLGRCIANPDGVSINWGDEDYDEQISPAQAVKYKQDYSCCYAVFTWSADQQGLGGTSDYHKPPVGKRKFVVRPEAIEGHLNVWFK